MHRNGTGLRAVMPTPNQRKLARLKHAKEILDHHTGLMNRAMPRLYPGVPPVLLDDDVVRIAEAIADLMLLSAALNVDGDRMAELVEASLEV